MLPALSEFTGNHFQAMLSEVRSNGELEKYNKEKEVFEAYF